MTMYAYTLIDRLNELSDRAQHAGGRPDRRGAPAASNSVHLPQVNSQNCDP